MHHSYLISFLINMYNWTLDFLFLSLSFWRWISYLIPKAYDCINITCFHFPLCEALHNIIRSYCPDCSRVDCVTFGLFALLCLPLITKCPAIQLRWRDDECCCYCRWCSFHVPSSSLAAVLKNYVCREPSSLNFTRSASYPILLKAIFQQKAPSAFCSIVTKLQMQSLCISPIQFTPIRLSR